jgi:hypothetical protein
MVAYIFDNILAKGVRAGQIPARTTSARDWFRDAAKSTFTSGPAVISTSKGKAVRSVEVGNMYLFNYDPKHKKTLPFYDRFPLIFMIGGAPGGFMGINMHYLPLTLRAKLMDALYDLSTDSRYDENTRLRVSYNLLKRAAKYNAFKPCVKHYLGNHVKSSFIKIDAAEWDIALFLPLQRFVKANKETVYADSRQKIFMRDKYGL